MTIRKGMAPSDVIYALENAVTEVNEGHQYYIRLTEEEVEVITGLLRTSEDAQWGDDTTPRMNRALQDNFHCPDWQLAQVLFECGQTLERALRSMVDIAQHIGEEISVQPPDTAGHDPIAWQHITDLSSALSVAKSALESGKLKAKLPPIPDTQPKGRTL